MNNKIGSSFLAAAALAGLMSGMAFAADTTGGAASTDKTAAPASDAAPAKAGKKAKKSAKGNPLAKQARAHANQRVVAPLSKSDKDR